VVHQTDAMKVCLSAEMQSKSESETATTVGLVLSQDVAGCLVNFMVKITDVQITRVSTLYIQLHIIKILFFAQF